jgi:Flp pilus assembly protein TadG
MHQTHQANGNLHVRPTRQHRGAVLRALVAGEGGQALVEVALVLPILLLFIVGVATLALAENSHNDETHLANEIARYASVNENPSKTEALQTWAKNQADNKALRERGKVCITFPKGTSNVGDPVQVTLTYVVNWLPVLKLKVASSTVEGKAVMRLEAPPSNYSAGCA